MDTETVIRSTRQVPSAHFMMKFKSYSLLSKSEGKYDSPCFEAGGYKWKLSFYPNGDQRLNGGNYISFNLKLCENEILSTGLFVYNHVHNNYLTFQAMRRFHEKKNEWGFEQLESLETFIDLSKGYLLDDSCTFGAEVFVINPTLNSISVSLFAREKKSNPIFRLEIKEFSKRDKYVYGSEQFGSGGATCCLGICPKGYTGEKGKAVFKVFFFVRGPFPNSKSTMYADYRLRVIDQLNSKHKERSGKKWFNQAGVCYSLLEVMSIEYLHKSSNGYVVEDTLIVEVELFIMLRTEVSES